MDAVTGKTLFIEQARMNKRMKKPKSWSWWYALLGDVPGTSGVYSVWSKGSVLYIGMARNLNSRLREHSYRDRFKQYGADEVRILPIHDLRACEHTEEQLIWIHRPPLNKVYTARRWQDDKPRRAFQWPYFSGEFGAADDDADDVKKPEYIEEAFLMREDCVEEFRVWAEQKIRDLELARLTTPPVRRMA